MIALANSSGAIIKRYKYDSFGVEENPGIFDTNVFRYCGEYYDAENLLRKVNSYLENN